MKSLQVYDSVQFMAKAQYVLLYNPTLKPRVTVENASLGFSPDDGTRLISE
jgi:hypothetical protein